MNIDNLSLGTILLLVIPIIVIQLGLQIFALVDLTRHPQEQIKWFNKWVWAAIIILGEIIGPIVYFLVARKEE